MMGINELIATEIINRATIRLNEISNERLKAEQDIKNKQALIKMYDAEVRQQVDLISIMYDEIIEIKVKGGNE